MPKKYKKNTFIKKEQNRGESLKKVPPKDGKVHLQLVQLPMAWTVYKPLGCKLRKKHKDNKKKSHNKANSVVIPSAATTAINPCYAAPLATFANLDEDE